MTFLSSDRFAPSERWLRWGLWLAYVAIIGYVGLHHQPGRDEVDTWVMVRDANFHEFFAYFPYAGHPPLWYLLNLPFARWMALPIETQHLFPFLLGSGVVWLLLFRSPFPLWLLIPCIFSVHLLFQYGVIARGYPLLLLLLFLMPVLHSTRFTHPFRYAGMLALLFQTEIYAWAPAGMLTLFFMMDCWERRRRKKPRGIKNAEWWAIVLPILSAMAAVAMLWPRPNPDPAIHLHYAFDAFPVALLEGFIPFMSFAPVSGGWIPHATILMLKDVLAAGQVLIIMAVTGAMISFIPRSLSASRSVWLFAAWIGAFYVIVSCVYSGDFWHWGMLPLFLLFTYWFARVDAPSTAKTKETISFRSPPPERFVYFVYVLLAVTFTLSAYIGACMVVEDARHPYSGAPTAAAFLQTHAGDAPIIAVGCHQAVSIAAHFPQGRIWLDSQQRFVNFNVWDYSYYQCKITPTTVMVARSLKHFASADDLWLVSDKEIKNARGYGLIERFASPGLAEGYWVYEKRRRH